MAKIDGRNPSGLSIVVASIVAAQFTSDTESFSEEPTPALFVRLHSASLSWYEALIEGTMIDFLQDQAIADHRGTVERLRQVATELGIAYVEPHDPLLSVPPESWS